jgi:hypothetical protein
MTQPSALPDDFLQQLRTLEESYLAADDPIRQSGFGGGAARWRVERAPILDALGGDGALLDIGCANGYLLECLVAWGRDRGLRITPFGLDYGAGLIALARTRQPQFADHFFTGNAWEWQPPRRFRYVYTLHDCVPSDRLAAYIERLLERVVAPSGRLIVGAYGSRSRKLPPLDIGAWLRAAGWTVAGTGAGGEPPNARFAWIDTATDHASGSA